MIDNIKALEYLAENKQDLAEWINSELPEPGELTAYQMLKHIERSIEGWIKIKLDETLKTKV